MKQVVLVALVVIGLIVSGCASESPAPVSYSATPIPSASVTPEPDVPTVLLDLSCDDLASTATASQYVGTAVSPVDGNAGPGFSRSMALQQLGGLICAWDDGDSANDAFDHTHRSLQITLLPDAEAKWDRYAESYDIAGDEFRYCYARDDYICGYFALVNGTWIESYVQGIRPASVAQDADAAMIGYVRPLFDAMAAAVSVAQPTGDRWLPSALPLPSSCEGFIAPSDIAALTGVTAALDSYTFTDGPQVDQTLGLDGEDLMTTCFWSYQGSDGGIGDMSVVPGGAWAWDVSAESAGATSMAIEGLRDDQYGYYLCAEDQGYRICSINFTLGGNWFELTLYSSDGSYAPAFNADQPEALVAIAEKIIANMS